MYFYFRIFTVVLFCIGTINVKQAFLHILIAGNNEVFMVLKISLISFKQDAVSCFCSFDLGMICDLDMFLKGFMTFTHLVHF